MELTASSVYHEWEIWVEIPPNPPKRYRGRRSRYPTKGEALAEMSNARERSTEPAYWGVRHTEVTRATDDIEWVDEP